jgi:hypothetical protein
MIKTKEKKITTENRREPKGIPFPEDSLLIEDTESGITTGVTGLYHPSESDIMDELSRLDSYQYGKYNR